MSAPTRAAWTGSQSTAPACMATSQTPAPACVADLAAASSRSLTENSPDRVNSMCSGSTSTWARKPYLQGKKGRGRWGNRAAGAGQAPWPQRRRCQRPWPAGAAPTSRQPSSRRPEARAAGAPAPPPRQRAPAPAPPARQARPGLRPAGAASLQEGPMRWADGRSPWP